MIIKEKLIAPLNVQIKSEFSAHAQYIAIGVYLGVFRDTPQILPLN